VLVWAARSCWRPSPEDVPAVPSSIIWWISEYGQGVCTVPSLSTPGRPRAAMLVLHEPVPLWDCMSPGLKWEYCVVMTRTQPVDSCMTIAKMNRASTPVDEARSRIAVFRSAISSSLSLGTFHAAHEACMLARLEANMYSKSTHSDISGQPAPTVPLPVKVV